MPRISGDFQSFVSIIAAEFGAKAFRGFSALCGVRAHSRSAKTPGFAAPVHRFVRGPPSDSRRGFANKFQQSDFIKNSEGSVFKRFQITRCGVYNLGGDWDVTMR